MLRQVESFTPEQWDKQWKILRKNLAQFRKEINDITDRQAALTAVSKLDGYISMPMLLAIQKEIREITELKIKKSFNDFTGKTIEKAITNEKEMRNIIEKVLKHGVRKIFETMVDNTSLADLTCEKVKSTLETGMAQVFFDKGIKPHLKPDKNEEEARTLFIPLLLNELYCLCADDLYTEADKRQTAGDGMLLILMAPLKLKGVKQEVLLKPFKAIAEAAKLLKIDDATKALWNELSIWLEGLFLRTYLQIPQQYRDDQDFSVKKDPATDALPVVNEKDKSLQTHFEITMYDITKFHLAASKEILKHIVPNQPAVLAPVKENEAAKEMLPLAVLEKIKNKPVEGQFTMLVSSLEIYELTEWQKKIFSEYTGVVESTLTEYTTSSTTTYGVPTFFKARTHRELAVDTIQLIKLSEDKPLDQVNRLFELWKSVKKEGSHDLVQRISDLMMTLVGLLYDTAEIDHTQSAGLTH